MRGFGSACESAWGMGLVFWDPYGPLFSVLFGSPQRRVLEDHEGIKHFLSLLWTSLAFLQMSLVILRISLFSLPLDILHF